MNEIILMVQGYLLYPENYTKEQLEKNCDAAFTAACAAAYSGARAAFTAARAARADYTAAASARAANAAALADNDYATLAEFWLDEYFNETGENRQDYIDAIHKENK